MTAATRTVSDNATQTAAGLPAGLVNGPGGSRLTGPVADDVEPGDHPGERATRPARGAAVQRLLRRRAGLPASHPDHAALRVSCIEAGLPLARCLAARYRDRGVPLDDLYQVAALALVKAVDGYDPTRQAAFTSYAVPTILGALKRHFRDTTWQVRVPRRIQALALHLAPHSASLTQRLGRSPTLAELAACLDVTEQDVAIARNAWRARYPDSLDVATNHGGQQHRPLIDTLGGIDARLDAIADRHTLRPLLAALPLRQRRMLAMRYVDEMTQAEIAAQIGVSQMHVSRLLAAALTQLRTGMLAEPPSRPNQSGTRPASAPASCSPDSLGTARP
jgi:RNA polymerase sigma-B factor